MRAINHALTGALIGLMVNEPIVAIPAAVISHYLLDVIPHHGEAVATEKEKIRWLKSNFFRYLIYADGLLCGLLVLLLVVKHPIHWLLAAICAFAAAAPDLLSINHYKKVLEDKKWKPGWYTTFAGRIQWFERPIGGVVEVVWFVAVISLLLPFLR